MLSRPEPSSFIARTASTASPRTSVLLAQVRGSSSEDENTTFDSGDFRNTVPRFDIAAREANQAFVELLRRIAERRNATPAQVALAWLLAGKPWIVPIPGTTKLHRLEENIAAADLALTSDDLREIEEARLEAQGARYAEAQQRMIDR